LVVERDKQIVVCRDITKSVGENIMANILALNGSPRKSGSTASLIKDNFK